MIRNDTKVFIRLLLYGWKLDYHLNKKDKFNFTEHKTIMAYHFEMAKYYYKKIYGKDYK